MAESISIRERILRCVKARLEAIDDVGTVYRFDGRLVGSLVHLDILLYGGDVSVAEGEQGNIGSTIKALGILVYVHLAPDETAIEATDVVISRWLAKVERELMQYPEWEDTQSSGDQNGERLAIDTRLVSQEAYDFDQGVVRCASTFEIEFQHDRDNPYIGPGITELTE